MKVFFNDSIINEEHANVSIFDHGFLYGDGVFETLAAYNGVVFMLKDHIARLKRSAELISLRVPYGDDQIAKIVYDTLASNQLKEAYIRITITRGVGPIGLDIDLCEKPTFLVITRQSHPYPEELYERGMKVIVSDVKRNIVEAINPAIKSMNFLNNILAKTDAKKNHADEALMCNVRGHLTEGTVSNLFFSTDGILYTPSIDCGILEGITRNLVVDLARKNGIKVIEGQYFVEDLYQASEVFLTNTSMEVMPVSCVGVVKFNVGAISKFLRTAFINGFKGTSPFAGV
ncbi:MAG: aminotransferase class IV [Nitrospirae bacterium]|nr:aminotransferase class IV [Nitrospirota bacterium]